MDCRFTIIILITAIFLCTPCIMEVDAETTGLLLYEVNKIDANEGVSIHNYSSCDIDLKGYVISDTPDLKSREGYIEFTESLIIHSNETFTFAKNVSADVDFTNRNRTFSNGDSGVVIKSGFNLASNGDDVYLFHNGKIIDAFCFGNVKIADEKLWKGESFTFKNGFYAVRNDVDTNTASDWVNCKKGYTHECFNPDLKYDAEVTPFLFPDSGGIPIYEALENAEDTVYITMYELTNRNLYALLCELEQRTGEAHVDVVLLLERDPLGHNTVSDDAGKMKALTDAGGEVYLIGEGVSRYTYVHAKYCVIDSEKVIVTSENWTTGNLCGEVTYDVYESDNNRGWGVIIDSKEYASYMTGIFLNDCDPTLSDVTSFADLEKTAKADKLTYTSPTEHYETKTYSAKVTPVLSPDNSFDATIYYISESKERVYSEQQSLTSTYVYFEAESPLKAMYDAAERGVDARFVMNCSADEETSIGYVDKINVTSLIKAAPMTVPYLHNKGSVCDDVTLISSVNWTTTSFERNREVCVAVHSKEIADFFAEAILSDFEQYYVYEGLDVTITELKERYDEKGEVTVTAEVVQKGDFSYEWSVDGNVVKTTSIPRTVIYLDDGEHVISVKVKSGDATGAASFKVSVSSDAFDLNGAMIYIAPLTMILIGIAIVKFRSSKRKARRGARRR